MSEAVRILSICQALWSWRAVCIPHSPWLDVW